MKKPFETYLTFIENELGVSLMSWQISVLYQIYNGQCPMYVNTRGGKETLLRAVRILKEEINHDTGSLPPRLYELDGYTTTVVTCDENWGENIIWEKEN